MISLQPSILNKKVCHVPNHQGPIAAVGTLVDYDKELFWVRYKSGVRSYMRHFAHEFFIVVTKDIPCGS